MIKVIFPFIVVFTIISSCSTAPEDDTKVIAIQPFNGFPNELRDTISNAITNYYHFNVVVYSNLSIPDDFYVNIKSPRYRADSIIRYLKTNKPDSIDYIVGLTSNDISTTKRDNHGNIKKPESKYKDWGIFGLGYRPGPSCIISNYRIKHKNKATYLNRLKKITLHELGHNLGLPHCENPRCFMRDAAETIKTIDEVELNLCDQCFAEI